MPPRLQARPRPGSDAVHGLRPAPAEGSPRLAARDRRAQILDTAFDVFSEKGFHGARTRERARRAGVSEGLVFRNFPTKEALVRAILDRVGLEDLIPVLEESLSRMTPRTALIALAERVLT